MAHFVSQKDIDGAEFKDSCINEWKDIHSKKNAPWLYNQGCIYVCLVILKNTKHNGIATKYTSVLKIGYTEFDTKTSSVYHRMYSLFDTNDAVWVLPLLVIQIDKPRTNETKIHTVLKKYKLNIACRERSGNYKIPREFYGVDSEILTIVEYICESGRVLFSNDNLKDKKVRQLKPLFLQVEDNLSPEQIQKIRQY